jgi:hypothetical protein
MPTAGNNDFQRCGARRAAIKWIVPAARELGATLIIHATSSPCCWWQRYPTQPIANLRDRRGESSRVHHQKAPWDRQILPVSPDRVVSIEA